MSSPACFTDPLRVSVPKDLLCLWSAVPNSASAYLALASEREPGSNETVKLVFWERCVKSNQWMCWKSLQTTLLVHTKLFPVMLKKDCLSFLC